jgi:hypothetical protein
MKKLFLLLLFTSWIAEADDLTLAEIIQRNTQAVGGQQAIESVKSIEISLRIEEPEFTVDAVYVAERKGRMRIDIYSGKQRVYTEAFDGMKGWQAGAEGPAKDSTPKGSAALFHGIVLPGKLYGLHEMTALGNQLELLNREEIEGVNYYVMKLTLTDGYSLKYYINPDSWLIDRSRDVRALHPDVDPTPTVIESRFLDYSPVNGVARAFRMEEYDVEKGQRLQKGTIKKIKYNIQLSDSLFSKP